MAADTDKEGNRLPLGEFSHALRTPLSSTLSWARLLQNRFKGNELLDQGLKIIVDNTLAQSRLIADLLDNGAITAGELELEAVDLNDIVGSICATQRLAAGDKGLVLTCDLREQPGPINADRGRLRQVVLILLANAIKSTPAGGQVVVTTSGRGSWRVIEVRDTGGGVEADLSIVRHIVSMHGGQVEVGSDGPGRGANISVLLPDHSADRAAAEGCVREALAGLRILVVEDQADMRDFLKRTLEDRKARVTVADGARAALELLRARTADNAYDALVSDIGMPAMDGYEFMVVVRNVLHLDARKLPAIAVTAYAREEDRGRALEAGFQAHLTKPYNITALVALLRRLTRESRG